MSLATSAGSTRTQSSILQSSLPSQEWLTRSLSVYQHGVQSGRKEEEGKNKTKTEQEDQRNKEKDGVQEEAEGEEQRG